MQPLRVVIAQADCIVAEALASSLHSFFSAVIVARTPEELRKLILKERADAAVVDLEMMELPQVADLCHEFASMAVITTHRIPDEKMWTAALNAGACDCCDFHDVRNIIGAIARGTHKSHFVAHAA